MGSLLYGARMEYVKREDSAAALYPTAPEGLTQEEVYHQQLNLAEVIHLAVQSNPTQLPHANHAGLALPAGLRSTPTMMQTAQLMGVQRMVPGQMGPTHALSQRGPQGSVPLPFHIKAELEEGNYYYEPMMHTFSNNATIAINHAAASVTPNAHSDEPPPVQYVFNGHTGSIEVSTAPPPDAYVRQQQFFQNYVVDGEGSAENLKVHRQYEDVHYSLSEDLKRDRSDLVEKIHESLRDNLPNENTKPIVNKLYYADSYDHAAGYNGTVSDGVDKNTEHEMYRCFVEADRSTARKFSCKMCPATFTAKKRLLEHTKLCAESGGEGADRVPKIQCKHCPYKCMSAAILKIHERTHTGEKPFACNFCEYKSGQKNNVAKHILVHMKEKPFRCQYCDYRCAQKNNLVVHERTHTGFKPFACTLCDYKTVQKPNLVKHMYLHSGTKPFSCDLCSYKCVQKTNLTKHKQRHDKGEKTEYVNRNANRPYRPRQNSFKCALCSFRCVRKSGLDKHALFKHGAQVNLESPQILTESVEYAMSDLAYETGECRTLSKSPLEPANFDSEKPGGNHVVIQPVEFVAADDSYGEKEEVNLKMAVMEGNDGKSAKNGLYAQSFKQEQVYTVSAGSASEGFPGMQPS